MLYEKSSTVDEDREQLIAVLRETRLLLQRPDNDLVWSSWENSDHAVREIDHHIQSVETGRLPDPLILSMLFGPTGPIQEVSLSSGWGENFLTIAERFDAVAKRVFIKQDARPDPPAPSAVTSLILARVPVNK